MFVFPVNSFQNRRIAKRCNFYIRLKWSQLRSMLIFYTPWKHQKTADFLFPWGTKGNIDPKWVKQQEFRRERHNMMFLAWNASSSIVKQNDCKNETTCLTQTTLSKSFSLSHTTYFEDIKEFFYFFVQNLFYIKRFHNAIAFKLSKVWN